MKILASSFLMLSLLGYSLGQFNETMATNATAAEQNATTGGAAAATTGA